MTATLEASALSFESPALLTQLEASGPDTLNVARFGVVRLDAEGRVVAYNTMESQLSGLSASTVMGRHFFTDVAPCTNNFMVAHRFHEESELDDTIDYVFTYKMKPTAVRLRLLRSASTPHSYLLVQPVD